ncbi:hypothetical protein G6L00_03035 [Agrobacterium rhizogenes]|nr:hypothetical protein [Rhizobium rhizogenes]NTI99285.1 hypothetical protein [Rhizobium rhizogenes]
MADPAVTNVGRLWSHAHKDFSAFGELFAPMRISPISPRFFESLREIDGYQTLSAGWDGPSSLAPSRTLIAAAKGFLGALPDTVAPPEASVSADGSVSWFWDTDEIYATVSFSHPGRYAYFAKNKDTGYKVKDVVESDLSSVPLELLEALQAAA